MILDEVVRSAVSRARIVRVRNVLNPFLWGFVWSVIFAVLTYLFKDDAAMKYACLVLAAAPKVTALAIGVGFAIAAPDRLQSEEFVLRQRALKTLYRRGGSPAMWDAANNISTMEKLTRLPRPEEKDE